MDASRSAFKARKVSVQPACIAISSRCPPARGTVAKMDMSETGRCLHLLVIAMAMLYACATSRGSSLQASPQGSSHQAAQAPRQSDNHIYVTSGGLDGDCYQALGELNMNESFAQSVVQDADSQAQRLRELARAKYPGKVDAIINVREQQNDAGTAVEVTGEAVHVRNHETIACIARGMPGVVDSAAAASAGGIVGTVIGGLSASGGSVYGAETGGVMGASAAAGIEMAKRRQQQQAQEALVGDRLEQQQHEIEHLTEQLSQLIEQQCDTEELSQQDCNQRIATVQQQIAKTNEPARSDLPGKTNTSAPNGAMSEFQVRNRIQEQQEIIDQLQQRIAQIKVNNDSQ
jgi:hypothetical protein